MNGEELEEAVILGPGTEDKTVVTALSGIEFTTPSPLKKEGGYVLAVKRKSTFFTKTTEGYKRQPQKGLKSVLSSGYYHSYMKAVANVGEVGGKVDTVVGHDLEILPLVNPLALGPGDDLPIKVLLRGKPFKTEFLATYGGFSTENGVYAYAASTDKRGMGKIRILASGACLIKMNYKEPYKDPEMCDDVYGLCTFTGTVVEDMGVAAIYAAGESSARIWSGRNVFRFSILVHLMVVLLAMAGLQQILDDSSRIDIYCLLP